MKEWHKLKGDNERVTQTEGWHTLNLLHGRGQQTHFTLILCSKQAEIPDISMKPNSLWIICIFTQWWLPYVLFKYQLSFKKICWAVEQRSSQDKKRLTDGLVKTLNMYTFSLFNSFSFNYGKSLKKSKWKSHWILYYIP